MPQQLLILPQTSYNLCKAPELDKHLKYYSKKDKINIKWPCRTELYNYDKFIYTLVINNNIPKNVFYTKQQRETKIKINNIYKIMKDLYDFKYINTFNDNFITILYKILKFDDIIIEK